MKTRYKFIYFEKEDTGGGRERWYCLNNRSGNQLGEVCWYAGWKRWVFQPETAAEFSADCLTDIADFMGRLSPYGERP